MWELVDVQAAKKKNFYEQTRQKKREGPTAREHERSQADPSLKCVLR